VALAKDAPPLRENLQHPRHLPPAQKPFDANLPSLFLLHEEDADLHNIVETFKNPVGALRISRLHRLSPFEMSGTVQQFVTALSTEVDERWQDRIGAVNTVVKVEDILLMANELSAKQIVTPYAPCGPVQSFFGKLTRDAEKVGVEVVPYLSRYDRVCWPHSTHGFFRFKDRIPEILDWMSL